MLLFLVASGGILPLIQVNESHRLDKSFLRELHVFKVLAVLLHALIQRFREQQIEFPTYTQIWI